MRVFVIIKLILLTQAVAWAQSSNINAEDFKPVALESEVAVKAEKAEANSNTSAEPIETIAEVPPEAAAKAPAVAEKLKESQIPVLTQVSAAKSTTKSPWTRVIFSFFVIAVIAAVLFRSAKWWQKKAAINTDNNKIRILNQHYLGPRKSLAIIQVAGESILIGVTDQNISLIKSLALLDGEDVTNAVPQNFAEELAQKNEDIGLSAIKDKVSSKIKEMRPL